MKRRLSVAALLAVLATPAWAHGDAQAHAPMQAQAAASAPARAPESDDAANTGPWPRLFFTPDERRRVTQQRLATLEGGRLVSAASAGDDGAVMAATARRAAPRVDGISLVRGARHAAWIGGRRVEDGGRWDGYRLRVTRNGVEFIDAAGTARLVKVGQPVSQAALPPGRAAP